jgi:hypothetical protein
MAFTETTSTGWFGRIGSSIKGIFFGMFLILISLVVMVWNESNAVDDIRANKELGEKVVSVASETVDAGNDGELVHLNGAARTDDIVKNEAFGITENAVRLSWQAEIYQWVEESESETRKKLGGGEETVRTYTYDKEWVDTPVDSSGFKEAGHENIGGAAYRNGSSQAELVTLEAFQLPSGLIEEMSWSEPYPIKEVPAELAEKGALSGGIFYSGTPDRPEIGDEKVTFSVTRPDDVSVMAVQSGETFTPFTATNGKVRFLLSQGLLSAEEMIQEEEKKAKFLRWALRGGGVFLMFFGFLLILKPLSVLADVLPILGSLVGGVSALIAFLLSLGISFVVIAISWISFRPLLGISLLVVAVACFFLIQKKMSQGKGRSASVPPPLNE